MYVYVFVFMCLCLCAFVSVCVRACLSRQSSLTPLEYLYLGSGCKLVSFSSAWLLRDTVVRFRRGGLVSFRQEWLARCDHGSSSHAVFVLEQFLPGARRLCNNADG